MKIISFSDLHLELGAKFVVPNDSSADVVILSGDIICFNNFEPLKDLLKNWDKPVLYVAGNHEYYTKRPMDQENTRFKNWISSNCPRIHFLDDKPVSINGVHFFGGTMWTDFNQGDEISMMLAQAEMSDFRLIKPYDNHEILVPQDTIHFHEAFKRKLISWFDTKLIGPRVVISHHAPTISPNTKYLGSLLTPAFSSLDMIEIIDRYQPALWIYGHTHECDDQLIGQTRIVSNQLGYLDEFGKFECSDFKIEGCPLYLEID